MIGARLFALTGILVAAALLTPPRAHAAEDTPATAQKSVKKAAKKKSHAKKSAVAKKKLKYLQPVGSSAGSAGTGKRLKSAGTKAMGKSASDEKLSRDLVFDGSTVNGKYHSAGEAVAKVEQEKSMIDLIGMRRDFKDRLAIEKERVVNNRPVTDNEGGTETAN